MVTALECAVHGWLLIRYLWACGETQHHAECVVEQTIHLILRFEMGRKGVVLGLHGPLQGQASMTTRDSLGSLSFSFCHLPVGPRWGTNPSFWKRFVTECFAQRPITVSFFPPLITHDEKGSGGVG